MALSGATFTFWTTLGPVLFPAVVPAGGSLLLGLQLACNVLVIESFKPALANRSYSIQVAIISAFGTVFCAMDSKIVWHERKLLRRLFNKVVKLDCFRNF